MRRRASAIWDWGQADLSGTETCQRILDNGLWRWQPARSDSDPDVVPKSGWGCFKVPGSWPGITDYMQKDCRAVFPHPDWGDLNFGRLASAWYQRDVDIPASWSGRRIVLRAEYVNSLAVVFVDRVKVGTILTVSSAGKLLAGPCRNRSAPRWSKTFG